MRIPKRLKKRPQWRGLPIPYIALITEDGTPDFKVTDEHKRRSVMANHWCQLCGEPLGRFCFFVGGSEAAAKALYFEPAAHLDCVIYAMQVCPFILAKIEHADPDKIAAKHAEADIKVIKEIIPNVAPDSWIIMKASGWDHVRQRGSPTVLCRAHKIKATPRLNPSTMSPADWRRVEKFLLR